MFCYHIEIRVKKYKNDELVDSLGTSIDQLQNEPGCLAYNIYQNYSQPDLYTVVGEWQTYRDMIKHFRTKDFKILFGAARVLGTSAELLIAETVSLTMRC